MARAKKRPILSICIPTYNHIGLLKKCLEKILSATVELDNVEIIVSDNGSDDGTYEYLQQIKNKFNFLFVYKNNENIGFNKNLFLLIKKYAKGKYVWTIGDDDFISQGIVKNILTFIKSSKENIDVILLKYLLVSEQEIDKECIVIRDFFPIKASYLNAIDNIADSGNLLATFMTCAIFKLDKVVNFDTKNIQINDWDAFPCVFPNGFILYENFGNSNDVYYLNVPSIFIASHKKEWDDRLIKIQEKIIPDFYYYIIKKNKKKSLSNTEKIIFKQLYFLMKNKRGNTFQLLSKMLSMHFVKNVISIVKEKVNKP